MASSSTVTGEAELPEGLAAQLSFYFSDSNLRRDRFLLRLAGADGTGKVPVATLATFNRVAALTTDVVMMVRALRTIDSLVVSEDGASVHRAEPLPSEDSSTNRTARCNGSRGTAPQAHSVPGGRMGRRRRRARALS